MATPMIKTIKHYPAKRPGRKTVFVLCGFGGSVWQTRRLLRILHKDGYDITALDFSKEVLSKGDPQLMINLMDEVTAWAENEAKKNQSSHFADRYQLGSLGFAECSAAQHTIQ